MRLGAGITLVNQHGAAFEQVKIAHQRKVNQQPRHDGFAGAWIVSQEKTHRLAPEHVFVNRGDLVR